MEKIDTVTSDITEENIKKLIELFPQVATEVENDEGEIEQAIDFDALRDLLGDVAEGQRERYQFTWPGKREAKAEARRPINKTMIPCKEKSKDWDTTENLYIEGDNLDALKLLKVAYAGKVKLIYIDPPYNTGKDFIYSDQFKVEAEEYNNESGEYSIEGGRLVANLESNGRFHSNWCSMIYPRLLLARDLLCADGLIFVSIDENEIENLLKIMNEIFSSSCQIGTIVWNKRVPKNDNKGIGNIHEYIVVYSKRSLSDRQLTMPKEGLEEIDRFLANLKKEKIPIPEAELALKQFYKDHDYDRAITLYNNLDDDYRPWGKINMSWPNANSFGPRYDIIHPATGKPTKVPDRGWRWKKETLEKEMGKGGSFRRHDGSFVVGRVWFAQDENTQPSSIKYLDEVSRMLLRSIISLKSDGGIEVEKLLNKKSLFSYPKPTSLLGMIFSSIEDSEGLYLDFFSGSGASAEAIMRLNAGDGGTRRIISVQIPDTVEDSPNMKHAGYESICEIGEERIRRAGEKIAEEVEKSNIQLKLGEEPKTIPDIGLRVLRIDSSNFEDTYSTPNDTQQDMLFGLIDNVKPGRTAEDILFQVLPAFRIPYSAHIDILDIRGKEVFDVNHGQLLACFDVNVTNDVIEEIARRKPSYAVMRDLSFKDDAASANFEELFKTFSPDTIRRVI